MKTILFVSVILIGLFINPSFFLVKAKKDDNQEEIIILDETKINVDDSRCFTVGDIDGDGISEVITFKSFNKGSDFQWIINTYHKDNEIWFPVLSKNYSEDVSEHIYKVDMGNFDYDNAQEIIIATWGDTSSKVIVFDFDQKQKEFKIEVIYEFSGFISDLEVEFNEDKLSDSIYILFSDYGDSVEHFKTNVLSITREKNGSYVSEIIFSEPKIYWSLFTIGRFIEQKSHKNQILLYRYEVEDSIKSPAVIKIITSDNELLVGDINIGKYSEIRDIMAWDRQKTDVDELIMLETNDMGGNRHENKLFYFEFNQKRLFEKEEQLLNTNKILNQLDSGNLDGNRDQLLILDPYAGTVRYLIAWDHYAVFLYTFIYFPGWAAVSLAFAQFVALYALDLNILVSSRGSVFYTSYGSTSSALLADLYQKVPTSTRRYYGADIVIGVSEAPLSDPFPQPVGRAYRPPYSNRPYSIIFPLLLGYDGNIIAHEVGHNYGLHVGADPHCDNFYCIMYFAAHPLQTDFCDICENSIDPTKFDPPPPPPPGGGGCPFLYVFDGTEYIGEGLLDIHDVTGIDKVYIHTLQTSPSQVNSKIILRLSEHPQTISDIDNVRLYGRLENGQWVSLHLKSAIHSTIGEVRKLLWFSDDLKVEELGADYNNGVSETIDLEFDTNGESNFLEFRFVIEGNNMLIK